MTYQNYWHDKSSTFEVEPYCVKVFRQRWYVVGNSAKQEIRIYSLDRVLSLQLTENHFSLPADFNAEEYFTYSFGISNYGKPVFVKVKVSKAKKKDRYFKALPLHHSQKISEENEDYTIFSYYIQPTYDFRQEILSHGSEVEVLAPVEFRSEIASQIHELEKRYKFADDYL